MLLVFGSINLDLTFRAPQLPRPGQTVLGHSLLSSPGGKGANQAHAAQRYGVATALVGAVGRDAMAEPALALLHAAGVDLSDLQRLSGTTGCASVVVDDAGANQIVVAPGVNLALAQDAVSAQRLGLARAVLLQGETDPAHNQALLQRARRAGCLTVLNNAPAGVLTPDALAAIDLLVVNEDELHSMAQASQLSGDTAALLPALAQRGPRQVVLTLGAAGVLAWDGQGLLNLGALPVTALDTTGAGDTFCGVLVAALVEGCGLPDALARASVAAGLSCTRAGAQASQPDRAEIESALPRLASAWR